MCSPRTSYLRSFQRAVRLIPAFSIRETQRGVYFRALILYDASTRCALPSWVNLGARLPVGARFLPWISPSPLSPHPPISTTLFHNRSSHVYDTPALTIPSNNASHLHRNAPTSSGSGASLNLSSDTPRVEQRRSRKAEARALGKAVDDDTCSPQSLSLSWSLS